MTDAVKMAIEALRSLIPEVPRLGERDDYADDFLLSIKVTSGELRAARKTLAALEQAVEPVAYLYHHSDKTIERREDPVGLTALTAADAQAGWTETPLYAHPPQSRVAADPVGLDELVKHMANRFLGWKLPGDFWPDGGISFISVHPNKHEPIGTNLFTATQAEDMVRYMLEGAPSTTQSRGQAFDGEGKARKPDRIKARADAIAHLTVPEDGNYKGNREYKQHFRIARDAALAAFEDITALSSAKRGEEG